ncbi:MAG: hypothetical protein NTY19_50855 [Planctomycetota bacterium]|nr:hypothetical protein [Planctomycetota bacterium]
MKKNAQPELSQQWWSKNKATTLKSTGLGKALKAYEDAQKKRQLPEAVKALAAVIPVVKKALGMCNKSLHEETIAALEKYPKVIQTEKSRLEHLLVLEHAQDEVMSYLGMFGYRLEALPKLMDKTEKEVQSGDAKNAAYDYGQVQSKAESLLRDLRPASLKKELQRTAQTAGAKYSDLDQTAISKKITSLATALKEITVRYGKLTLAYDALEVADPALDHPSPEYEKAFKEVVAYYRKLIGLLKSYVSKIGKYEQVAAQVHKQALEANDPTVAAKVLTITRNLHGKMREEQQESVNILYQFRDKAGSGVVLSTRTAFRKTTKTSICRCS